jgi:hypothetical protein
MVNCRYNFGTFACIYSFRKIELTRTDTFHLALLPDSASAAASSQQIPSPLHWYESATEHSMIEVLFDFCNLRLLQLTMFVFSPDCLNVAAPYIMLPFFTLAGKL